MINLLFLVLSIGFIQAQTVSGDFLSRLQEKESGKGVVKIHQSTAIQEGVVAPSQSDVNTQWGYRVQVYAGNRQAVSKKEAYDRAAMVELDFPLLKTYISFKSPFWRLRAGNFYSYEEADAMLRKMKQKGYYFVKEMYVVKDNVLNE